MAVFSLSDMTSCQAVVSWYQHFLESTKSEPNTRTPILFIGNKFDLKEDREVPEGYLKSCLEEPDHVNCIVWGYLEISVKNDWDITRSFEEAVRMSFRRSAKSK